MRPFLLPALVLALAVPAAAHADTFTFTASGGGGGFTGSGQLTGTNEGNGTYLITNVSGAGIAGPLSFNGSDNLLYPTQNSALGTYFDTAGFSFTDDLAGEIFTVDISSPSAGKYQAYLLDSEGDPGEAVPVTLTIAGSSTVTPEPSSLVLLGTGVLGAAGMVRRRFVRG